MLALAIAALFAVISGAVALRANRWLRDQERLPMQWGFSGKVTWSAPRPLALAFIPALGLCVLVALAALGTNVQPRAGQEDLALPAFLFIVLMFLAVQCLHLWLIRRTLRRGGG